MTRSRNPVSTLLVVPLSLVLSAASAETRTWTWRTGEEFEAEAIDFDTVVRMREPSGKVFGMSIGDLSDADQTYLAKYRVKLAGGPATDVLRFRPQVDWYKYNHRWMIRVRVEASSTATAAATTISQIRVEQCETSSGGSLVRNESDAKWFEESRSLKRYGCESQPPTGLEITLLFEPTESPIETISRLRGSFKMTTGEREEVTVPRFATQRNITLKSRPLSEAQLKVVLNPSGRQPGWNYDAEALRGLEVFRVGVTGNGRRVHSLELTDSRAHPHYGFASSAVNGPFDGENSESTWYYAMSKPIPKDLQLRLVVLKNLREVVVPFELANLKIPACPDN
jgi:hypothetical protein